MIFGFEAADLSLKTQKLRQTLKYVYSQFYHKSCRICIANIRKGVRIPYCFRQVLFQR